MLMRPVVPTVGSMLPDLAVCAMPSNVASATVVTLAASLTKVREEEDTMVEPVAMVPVSPAVFASLSSEANVIAAPPADSVTAMVDSVEEPAVVLPACALLFSEASVTVVRVAATATVMLVVELISLLSALLAVSLASASTSKRVNVTAVTSADFLMVMLLLLVATALPRPDPVEFASSSSVASAVVAILAASLTRPILLK